MEREKPLFSPSYKDTNYVFEAVPVWIQLSLLNSKHLPISKYSPTESEGLEVEI